MFMMAFRAYTCICTTIVNGYCSRVEGGGGGGRLGVGLSYVLGIFFSDRADCDKLN